MKKLSDYEISWIIYGMKMTVFWNYLKLTTSACMMTLPFTGRGNSRVQKLQ